MPSRTLTAEMSYMDHQLQPEDLLHFVELQIFTRAWDKELGLDDEIALSSLQICLMANPKGGDVIRGTEGLRKLRFAPESWQQGKRSAARVLYVYFEEFGLILLVYAYRKNETESLDADDLKSLNAEIRRIRRYLEGGHQID